MNGKIPDEYGDFVSTQFYKLSDIIEPTLFQLNITPNSITITRILMTVWGTTIVETHSLIAGFTILTGYFMDCLDGHYARRYGLVSNIGDYLDHIGDVVGYSVISWTLLPVLWPTHPYLILVMMMLTSTSIVQVSLEERYRKTRTIGQNSQSLDLISPICDPERNPLLSISLEKNLLFLRYLGSGTLFLYISWLFAIYNSL